MFATLKRTASFGVFYVKIRPGALAVASCKNPQKINTFWCAIWRAKSRMRRNETHGRIVTNFWTGVGVHDVITSANFYDSRVRGFGVVGGQILGFSIDLHHRVCDSINASHSKFSWSSLTPQIITAARMRLIVGGGVKQNRSQHVGACAPPWSRPRY